MNGTVIALNADVTPQRDWKSRFERILDKPVEFSTCTRDDYKQLHPGKDFIDWSKKTPDEIEKVLTQLEDARGIDPLASAVRVGFYSLLGVAAAALAVMLVMRHQKESSALP